MLRGSLLEEKLKRNMVKTRPRKLVIIVIKKGIFVEIALKERSNVMEITKMRMMLLWLLMDMKAVMYYQ